TNQHRKLATDFMQHLQKIDGRRRSTEGRKKEDGRGQLNREQFKVATENLMILRGCQGYKSSGTRLLRPAEFSPGMKLRPMSDGRSWYRGRGTTT
ncbi:MAG: hypothetical protein ACK53L_15200, partial [Pirellulaceae bacterium]